MLVFYAPGFALVKRLGHRGNLIAILALFSLAQLMALGAVSGAALPSAPTPRQTTSGGMYGLLAATVIFFAFASYWLSALITRRAHGGLPAISDAVTLAARMSVPFIERSFGMQ
ncbi:MAG: hypothetical protein ACJ8NR_17985 [Sulfurifustis sp.]